MQWPPFVGVLKLAAAVFILAASALAQANDAAAQSTPSCLQGPIRDGFSAVRYEGGSVRELEVCAYRLRVHALYVLAGDRYVSLLTGAPEFVNRAFHDHYPDGVAAGTTLIAKRGSAPPPDPYPPLAECSATAAAARVSPSVAAVRAGDRIGTAFYVGNFRWLTAEHVVSGESTVQLTNAEIDVTATVVGARADVDLAVLSAPSKSHPLNWGEPPAYASDALVLGYGLGHRTLAAGVTRGIVSERFIEDGVHYIRTDAPANPGNSGGPLIDICGNVIGIVQSKIADLTVEGVAFALGAESVRVLPVPAP
ncbi:MAG: trypsin-like peptidase domain-containing protein [Chloroflexota bacterium]|nr:trypsin-like peptidase domain-containing protein [Chloroflexota bacterium]